VEFETFCKWLSLVANYNNNSRNKYFFVNGCLLLPEQIRYIQTCINSLRLIVSRNYILKPNVPMFVAYIGTQKLLL